LQVKCDDRDIEKEKERTREGMRRNRDIKKMRKKREREKFRYRRTICTGGGKGSKRSYSMTSRETVEKERVEKDNDGRKPNRYDTFM
jgi:hypothetical protein